MTLIERTVQLPDGARAINQYSRNYALRPDGKIVAIYATPRQSQYIENEDSDCDVMLADFASRPCTAEEIASMKQEEIAYAARFGKANESRWFDDPLELPVILDGSCDQIEIVFDPSSQKIESAECNGLA